MRTLTKVLYGLSGVCLTNAAWWYSINPINESTGPALALVVALVALAEGVDQA